MVNNKQPGEVNELPGKSEGEGCGQELEDGGSNIMEHSHYYRKLSTQITLKKNFENY